MTDSVAIWVILSVHLTQGNIRIDLQSTLETDALQLKNVSRTLGAVASVVQKMMKTLYDAHFPDAENRQDCHHLTWMESSWLPACFEGCRLGETLC